MSRFLVIHTVRTACGAMQRAGVQGMPTVIFLEQVEKVRV